MPHRAGADHPCAQSTLTLPLSCLCESACSQDCLSQGDGKGATCTGTCLQLKTALTLCSQEISAGCRTVVLGVCATAGFLVAAASSAFLTPSPARPRTGCLSSQQCAVLCSGLAQHRPPCAKANTARRASSSQRRQLARDDPGAPEMPPT